MKIACPTSRDFAVAAAIGVASGVLCWMFLHRYQLGAGDFNWAYAAARQLLSGENPYAHTPPGSIPYPLPAALLALPFAGFTPEFAGAIFFGSSSSLLALGLIRQSPQRLLIFLAYPYWAALLTAQWTPLLMCAGLFPAASAFWVAKPNIGGPIAFTHLSRKGLLATAVLFVGSLVWMPRWPLAWVRQLGGYEHFIPLLIVPGPLLILALWRYRDRDAVLLFLQSLMPQRWFYDCFVLWLIPKTRRQILIAVACSWSVGLWRWYHMPRTMHEVGLWSILGFYLPVLGIVLWRRAGDQTTSAVAEGPRPSLQKSQISSSANQPS